MFDVALTGTETPAQRAALSNSHLTSELREFLWKFKVQTIIVLNQLSFTLGNVPTRIGHSAIVVSHVTAALGPPADLGGVKVWFHVRQRLAAVTR